MTRQAVWPRELLDRRAAATALLAALRSAEHEAADGDLGGRRGIVELRPQLAALPRPHWDVYQRAGGLNDWTCATGATILTPEWVPLEEQERHLPRLRGRRVGVEAMPDPRVA